LAAFSSRAQAGDPFLFSIAPLAFFLFIFLLAGDWFVAYNAARRMLREQLGSTAQVASDTLPFFLESGQNLIQQLAKNPMLYSARPMLCRS
jgi:hypothetical protein